MGATFSLKGASDRYYVSYEKAFEKIDKECLKLKNQQLQQQKRRTVLSFYFFAFSAIAVVFAAVQAAWVHRQPTGTYSTAEHFLRVSPVLLIPLLCYKSHFILSWFFTWSDSRNNDKIKKLVEAKRKMIKQLKDGTRFEKVMEIIKKYDPEYYQEMNQARTPLPVPVSEGTRKRMKREFLSHNAITSSSLVLQTTASAGRMLMPVFDKLASVIGDNPALLEELQKAQDENTALRLENEKLRKQLSELKGQGNETVINEEDEDEEVDGKPPRPELDSAEEPTDCCTPSSTSPDLSATLSLCSPDSKAGVMQRHAHRVVQKCH